MSILPDLHPMKASAVSNQGLPRISGCPRRLDFGCSTMKSTGYSQESKETVISSKTPSGVILDLSTYSKTIVVGLRFVK